MSTRLFVTNLPSDATPELVRAAFAAHGHVEDVHLAIDRYTGRPRGFGFVTMGSAEEAAHAAAVLNGALFDGRPIRVNGMDSRHAHRHS
jgi:RNA recognition motif-containing protein